MKSTLHPLTFLGILIPLLVLWFSLFLGNRPFATPDEGRYVEIPREMVASGDYITPRLNGVKYFEKPPLFYWVQAASIRLLGMNEWAMRLGCLFFGTLGCVGTYLFGRRFYGISTGTAACLILATSPLYYALSRLIILDMAVTTLVTLSLFSFLMAVHTSAGRHRRFWAWGFYSCSALAVLTKGLMALAISGPVILIWALSTGRWKDLWPAYLPSGTLLFLMIAAPWHILASLYNPEFAYKYFIVEHFLRYTTSMHLRTQPLWFFIPVMLVGFFPWVSLLWGAIRNGLKFPHTKQHQDVTLFLLIWAGWTFGFFSLSNSKLIPYILPCLPPLALILGSYWARLWQPTHTQNARHEIIVFATLAGILSLTGLGVLWMMPQLIDHRPYLWTDLTTLAIVSLLSGSGALLFRVQHRYRSALAILPLTSIVLVVALIRFMPELQRPSIKPLAQVIQTLKKPNDLVGCYKTYYQDLPVYTNQIVTVFGVKGELEFGCTVENCTDWMIDDDATFLNLWTGKRRLLIVARSSEVKALTQRHPTFSYISLGETYGNVLITNQP